MKKYFDYTEYFPDLGKFMEKEIIRRFCTKKEALATASQFGWAGKVLHIKRRFETIWVVGEVQFQPEYVLTGVSFYVAEFPLLKFVDGVQPVLKIRKGVKK